jgi:hypothetical protein
MRSSVRLTCLIPEVLRTPSSARSIERLGISKVAEARSASTQSSFRMAKRNVEHFCRVS